MADSGPASFSTRANALLRKNLSYQTRNIWSNIRLIMIPFYLCVLLVGIQALFDSQITNSADNQCGCQCTLTNANGKCLNKTCGIEYSSTDQAFFCSIPNPPQWPPLLQVPPPESRAVRASFLPEIGLPSESCRRTGSCPVTFLFTGSNHSLGASLYGNMLPSSVTVNSTDLLQGLAYNVLGTETEAELTNYLDPGIASDLPIYNIQSRCISNAAFPFSFGVGPLKFQKDLRCVQGLNLWRNNSKEVNDVIFKGYKKGNPEGKANEIAAAYDLLNTNRNNFNVHIWYNSTYEENSRNRPSTLVRVARSVNLVSNAYLQFLQGSGTKMLFEYVKEMPKEETSLRLDIASLIGPLFFTWVILLLFPVILSSLVYEKQERLRIIMKMHGLGDGPYWMISYAYFLTISTLYFICLMIFGSAIGLKFFRLNDYSLQFVFYFLYVNLQIALCFLVSSLFSKVKTSTGTNVILEFDQEHVGGFRGTNGIPVMSKL